MRDICRFIETATELGLYIIIRPSPYICAEWEFGGLPAWLLKDKNMRLRCCHEPYLQAVKNYYNALIPKLVPYQVDHGGNIILIQIENEYGYYGNDTAYLAFLRDTMRSLGITVPFVTSDGPWSESNFKAGCIDGALPTGNFGSNVEWQFGVMKNYIGEDKPLMCMEFWVGWFDAWGDTEHHVSDLAQNKKDLDELMRTGHLNFYMFQGGTNFGFMSGRNGGNQTSDVTSYDYDGILTEDGQITEKYLAFREIIGRYREIPQIPLSTKIIRKDYGKLTCTGKTDLFSVLGKIASPIHSIYPLTMEDVDQNYGYILYRAKVKDYECATDIQLEDAADRVQIFQNGKYLFTAFGDNLWEKFEIGDRVTGATIDLLCENFSRENFGTGLENQRKGIRGGVRINDHRHFGYDIYTLPLEQEQLNKLDFNSGYSEGVPAFYQFELVAEELGDTFLDFEGFGKGCAFINGFHLGRFWENGPQKRLYLPAPLLKKGKNTIIIFETEGKAADSIYLAAEPKLM